MDRDSIAKMTRAARERGYSWSQIAAYFNISKERVMQIAGYKIPKDVKKAVLERAKGHCEMCKILTAKLYVTRLDATKEQIIENCIALDRACFYEQNSHEKANGIANQKERRNRDVEVCFPEIARDLGIDIAVPDGHLDVVAEATGEETQEVPQPTAEVSVPEDGDGARSDNRIGSVGG